MNQNEFNASSHNLIAEFLQRTNDDEDEISESVKHTVAQFLFNFRKEIKSRATKSGKNWVLPLDIIDAQIMELRRCVVDLEVYRQRLIEGVTKQ